MSSQMSTLSTPDSVTPVPTSSLDHDDPEYWWDSYVTEFPTNFYVFLSQADYDELFSDDEEFYATVEPAYATVEPAYTTDEPAYTTDEPAFTTDEPADATVEPANATDKSVNAADAYNTNQFAPCTYVTDVAKQKCIARNYFAMIKIPNWRLLKYRPAAAAQTKSMKHVAGSMKFELAQYREVSSLLLPQDKCIPMPSEQWREKEKRLTPNFNSSCARRQESLREKG